MADVISSIPVPACYLCGSDGGLLYEGLSDRSFGAPGTWNMRQCPEPGCGLAWIDPMPTEEELWKAYRIYYTHDDGVTGEETDEGWPDLMLLKACKPLYKVFKRATGMRRFEKEWGGAADNLFLGTPAQGARLLDVGCGNGDFLDRMRRQGWAGEGLDVDADAVKQARAKHGLNVHVGSLEDLRFPGASFDAVTMNHVIEHVRDPVSLLRECLRVLKAGGRLAAVTPNLAGLGHRRFGRNWRGLEPPRHFHLFTRKTLGKCAAKAGCRSFQVFGVPGHGEGIFRSSIRLEESAARGKRWEFSRWAEASFLKVREYYLAKKDDDAGEEVALLAEKEM